MQVSLLQGVYDEIIELLHRARRFQAQRVNDKASSPDYDNVSVTCEILQVTNRLKFCLSWALVRKAVFNNEMTELEAQLPENRLEALPRLQSSLKDRDISRELRSLREDSQAMYQRIVRLDEMVSRQHHAA